MKRAVLEFPRPKGGEGASIDILKTLADLRSDLQCIERAIAAVERIAFARLGENAREAPKSVSRRK
jgi:hypothetical protein